MPTLRSPYPLAIALSVGLHALLIWWVGHVDLAAPNPPQAATTVVIDLTPTPEPPSPPPAPPPPARPQPRAAPATPPPPALPAPSQRAPASMEAPPAPTAQEWAQAATYTLKNSKRYRHTWGQQVRSMMGTAVEGADQGVVRFRIEIAPNGALVRLETLWSTSAKAEALARQAIQNMPPLPPTPTGQPLVFEKTISFQPFATDAPPIYHNDCLPDPPQFVNPYAWDGRSPPGAAVQPTGARPDPQAMEECLKQLPQDSIDAESAHDQRQLEQWGSGKLKP